MLMFSCHRCIDPCVESLFPIVALLVLVGSLKKDVNFVSEVLELKKRSGNLKSISGCGLYLEEVFYREDINE